MSAISSTYPLVHLKINTQLPVFFHIIYLDIYTDLQFHESPQTELFATLGYLSDAISTEEDRGSRDLHSFFVVKEENKLGDEIYNCVGFHFYFWAHPFFLRQPNLYPTVNPWFFCFVMYIYICIYIYMVYLYVASPNSPSCSSKKPIVFFFNSNYLSIYTWGPPRTPLLIGKRSG